MSRKLKYTILDDSESCIRTLSDLLKSKEYLQEYKVYTSAERFENELYQNPSEVFFMDIETGGKDGLELSKLLINRKIIVVSGHKERNNEATDLDDYVDFVKKPINPDRLERALQRLRKDCKIIQEFLVLPTRDLTDRRFRISDIVKIVTSGTDSRWKAICLTGHKTVEAKVENFENVMSQLDPEIFMQISKKCIINKEHIEGRRGMDEVCHVEVNTLADSLSKSEETIGTSYREAFLTWYRL